MAMNRSDVRTILTGGVKLGVVTAGGVVAFALLSRALSPSAAETSIQLQVILAGGALAAFLPAWWVRPQDADAIAWSALVGLLGALTFTVIDTAVLRPVDLYHWTWDEIGGGSGFWYIPVWWMASAFMAWLGAWVYAASVTPTRPEPAVPILAAQTFVGAELLFFLLVFAGVAPFHASVGGLAFGLTLAAQVPVAKALSRR